MNYPGIVLYWFLSTCFASTIIILWIHQRKLCQELDVYAREIRYLNLRICRLQNEAELDCLLDEETDEPWEDTDPEPLSFQRKYE